ncbi:Trehalose-6-phosphate phosphatase [Mycena sanguinolenta]|uniref:Trehalose-6-phosphate phosphatase n=1 Tax=Mycena sanguinolenta TaxID=230812 RepID=A0A8H6YSW7_9AGAR|nr:Trehalose-6-phosphate phosphatase [Mycena sanguinolenta]
MTREAASERDIATRRGVSHGCDRGQRMLVTSSPPSHSAFSSSTSFPASPCVSSHHLVLLSLFVLTSHQLPDRQKNKLRARLVSWVDLTVITLLCNGMNATNMEFVVASVRHLRLLLRAPFSFLTFSLLRVLLVPLRVNADADADSHAEPHEKVVPVISKHTDFSLTVNSWNFGDVATAINDDLLMSEPKKLVRHSALHKVVTSHCCLGSWVERRPPAGYPPSRAMYWRAGTMQRRRGPFEYDGTPRIHRQDVLHDDPFASTLTALEQLSVNVAYIISTRDGALLEHHLGHLKLVRLDTGDSCARLGSTGLI